MEMKIIMNGVVHILYSKMSHCWYIFTILKPNGVIQWEDSMCSLLVGIVLNMVLVDFVVVWSKEDNVHYKSVGEIF